MHFSVCRWKERGKKCAVHTMYAIRKWIFRRQLKQTRVFVRVVFSVSSHSGWKKRCENAGICVCNVNVMRIENEQRSTGQSVQTAKLHRMDGCQLIGCVGPELEKLELKNNAFDMVNTILTAYLVSPFGRTLQHTFSYLGEYIGHLFSYSESGNRPRWKCRSYL